MLATSIKIAGAKKINIMFACFDYGCMIQYGIETQSRQHKELEQIRYSRLLDKYLSA